MTTLLDAILDAIERGEPSSLVILEPTCRHPLLAGTTSYRRGCRCRRCWHAKKAEVNRRQRRKAS